MIPRPLPDEALLDQVLAQPTPAVVEALSKVAGNLLVLGAGGKMGPSLCRLAARALQEAGVPHRVVAVARFSDPLVRLALESAGVETIACNLFDREQVARLPNATLCVLYPGRIDEKYSFANAISMLYTRYQRVARMMYRMSSGRTNDRRIVGTDARLWLFVKQAIGVVGAVLGRV